MKISSKSWKSYIERLSRIDRKAASAFADWFREHPDADTDDLLNYAFYTSDYYGNAASGLACEMYDEVAVASRKTLPPAEPARTATYGEVAKAVMGRLLTTQDPDAVGSVVGTKVKTVGLDTLLKNSLRDGAEFAWIPSGDTCAFCIMLASNGWQRASKKALKNGHAEHVHNNCNCTYAIRFDKDTEVEGYDPEYYKDLYDNAEGSNWMDKVNYMRRRQREDPIIRDRINAQKRAAYAKANGSESVAPVVDYASAYTFANGDADLISNLRSGNCQKACAAVDKILNSDSYGLPKSEWSGIAKVGKIAEMPDRLGEKELDCSITIRSDRLYDIKTIIHEDLHARSYSKVEEHLRYDIYSKHKAIEEGTVEYLAQIICENSHIKGSKGYGPFVDALKDIKNVTDPFSTDYEFAKKLIAIPLTQRYNVVKDLVDKYSSIEGVRKAVLTRLEKDLEQLKPK